MAQGSEDCRHIWLKGSKSSIGSGGDGTQGTLLGLCITTPDHLQQLSHQSLQVSLQLIRTCSQSKVQVSNRSSWLVLASEARVSRALSSALVLPIPITFIWASGSAAECQFQSARRFCTSSSRQGKILFSAVFWLSALLLLIIISSFGQESLQVSLQLI